MIWKKARWCVTIYKEDVIVGTYNEAYTYVAGEHTLVVYPRKDEVAVWPSGSYDFVTIERV